MQNECLTPLPLDRVTVGGRFGAVTDAITEARYLGKRAANEIVPQAVEAFRQRVDDRMEPGRGYWQGEFWGKWVLGAVDAVQYCGDGDLRERIALAVREILATQDADGYIGTYHDSAFGLQSGRVFEWNVWCRKYTLWGLLAAYELLGDGVLLDAAVRLADHLAGQVGPDAADIVDTGWLAGLPSSSILVPMVHLYRHTREPRHLACARHIVERWSERDGPPDLLRKGLSGAPVPSWFPRPETWAKTYELLSCVEGMVELFRETGDADLLAAARNIFLSIRETDRHVVGGLSNSDMLTNSRFLVQAPMEVCDAVHWVRLALQLFRLSGDALYADEIETTAVNVFLGASGQNPFWGVRRQLLCGAHWVAPEHCGLSAHHCCVANLPRGLYQVIGAAVLRSDAGPVVAFYLPGRFETATPSGVPLRLEVETAYPADGRVDLRLGGPEAERFTLRLRVPAWSASVRLRVNDAEAPAEVVDGWLSLERTWTDGDRVTLDLEMAARVVPLPTPSGLPAQPFGAVVRGPVVLTRDLRFGDAGSIHEPVGLLVDGEGRLPLEPLEPPEGIAMAFAAPARTRHAEADRICLCDYASAGNTWDVRTSDFRAWLPTDMVDPRVGA